MPPVVVSLKNRLAAVDLRHAGQLALLIAINGVALGILLWSEVEPAAQAAFLLTWGVLNGFWLTVLRRPATAAALSLALIVILIVLSQFKYSVLMMTATFVDLMVVDLATFSFLMTIIPGLGWQVGVAVLLGGLVVALIWQLETLRVRRRAGFILGGTSFVALAALSFALPMDREDEFLRHQYVSKFARSAAVAAIDLATRGVLEADATAPDRLPLDGATACDTTRKRPHIVMVFDESSFDATMLPNVKVAEG